MENSRVGLADVTKPPQLEVSLELSMNLDVSKPALDITKPGLDISKPTLARNCTNATNVTMHLFLQAI